MRIVKSICCLLFMVSTLAWGKTFRSKFITMELPPNWDCQQDELDWVCQPENPNLRNEALVVIVTKAANPADDSLAKYEEYLKTPKKMRDLVGNTYTTQIKYTRQKQIRDHMWIDSLQIGSEVPGFISRYVASVKEQIGALISYHVAESVFPKWGEILDKMIDSAELRFDPKAFAEIMKNPSGSLWKPRNLGGRDTPAATAEAPKAAEGDSNELLMNMLGAGILVAAVAFYIWKKKMNKGS